MNKKINTFRPGCLYISNSDACSVAGLLVDKKQTVNGTKLPFCLGHFPFGYIEWLPLLYKSHMTMLPLFQSFF